MAKTESDIRRLLGLALRSPPDQKLFEYLAEETHVAAVVTGEKPVTWLVDQYLRLARVLNLPAQGGGDPEMLDDKPRRPHSSAGPDLHRERLDMLSRLFALMASRDSRVVAFREGALEGKLLAPDQVESWIQEQAERDGEPTGSLSVALPPESVWERIRGGKPPDLAYAPADWLLLRYGRLVEPQEEGQPRQWAEQWVPVAEDGMLDWLRLLVGELAEEWRWSESEATLFVLTGQAPRLSGIEGSIEAYTDLTRDRWLGSTRVPMAGPERPAWPRPSAALRITMEIDPAWPPQAVAKAYALFRKQMRCAPSRALSRKHLHLALFTFERPPKEPWADTMRRWNEETQKEAPKDKDWRYTKTFLFKRDCLTARRRLLYPDFGGFGQKQTAQEQKEEGADG